MMNRNSGIDADVCPFGGQLCIRSDAGCSRQIVRHYTIGAPV